MTKPATIKIGGKNMSKKILSEDSRERLVVAYEKTKDIASVALMFGVAQSTVYRLAAQKRKTSSLALQTAKRGRKYGNGK